VDRDVRDGTFLGTLGGRGHSPAPDPSGGPSAGRIDLDGNGRPARVAGHSRSRRSATAFGTTASTPGRAARTASADGVAVSPPLPSFTSSRTAMSLPLRSLPSANRLSLPTSVSAPSSACAPQKALPLGLMKPASSATFSGSETSYARMPP